MQNSKAVNNNGPAYYTVNSVHVIINSVCVKVKLKIFTLALKLNNIF